MRQHLTSQGGGLAEDAAPFDLQFPGPEHLPFDHDDVRVYVDNLFTDGLLIPDRQCLPQAGRRILDGGRGGQL